VFERFRQKKFVQAVAESRVLKVIFRIKPMLDKLRPIIQARLQERGLLEGKPA
jgi:hypothetical protein